MNLKGGSGKTTIAINLAAALGEKKLRAVLFDLDPQRSASRWSEQAQAGDDKGFDLGRDVHGIVEKGASARIVKETIERVAGDADVVVLDCPPELEDRSLVAAMLSDLLLIPVTPSPLDFWAAERAVDTAKDARAVRDGKLPLVSLVPSRLATSTVLARDLPATLATLKEPVAPGISQRVALVEAAVAGKTIIGYAPGSPAHDDFRALAGYVVKKLKNAFV